MDPVSLVFGISGFIAVVLKACSSVVQSINSYRNLSSEVGRIITAIIREEALFADHVYLLLVTCMAEGDRTELIITRGSAPEYSHLHAQIFSWEDWFHKLEREFTEQQEQDGTDPDEFRMILLEMELIKDVWITFEAINEIRNTYLKPSVNEGIEA